MEKPILVLKRRALDKALKEVETKCMKSKPKSKKRKIELAPREAKRVKCEL